MKINPGDIVRVSRSPVVLMRVTAVVEHDFADEDTISGTIVVSRHEDIKVGQLYDEHRRHCQVMVRPGGEFTVWPSVTFSSDRDTEPGAQPWKATALAIGVKGEIYINEKDDKIRVLQPSCLVG